jgi:hypothetical protein
MKVFVLYVLNDYSHAVYMSKYENACEMEKQKLRKKGVTCSMWIEEYDFSESNSFELDSD